MTEASGMNGVVPAWRLLELMEQEEVQEAIKFFEDQEVEHLKNSRVVIEQSVALPEAVPLATYENPNHREDFTSLVDAAAQKRKQGD